MRLKLSSFNSDLAKGDSFCLLADVQGLWRYREECLFKQCLVKTAQLDINNHIFQISNIISVVLYPAEILQSEYALQN